jgi:hypothetical protein
MRAQSRLHDLSARSLARLLVSAGLGLAVLAPGAAAASPMAIDLALRAQPEDDSSGDPGAAGGAPAGEAPSADAPASGTPTGEAPAGDAPTGEAEPPPPAVAPEGTQPQNPEGPSPDDEYATSKDAGQGMSGREEEKEEGPQEVETVGEQKVQPKGLSHVKTAQIGAAAGVGYGLTTAGDKYCGEFSDDEGDQDKRKSLCTARTPAVLDAHLGFGANDRIDIVVGVRINLEKRDYDDGPCKGDLTCVEGKGLFVDKRGIGVMPGVRLWGKDNDKVFKVGGAIDFMYMYESFQGYRDRPALDDTNNNIQEDDGMTDAGNAADEDKVSDHIIGFRGGPILQVDPHHNIGIFFIPAAVPSFRPQQRNAENSGWFEISFEATIGVQARFP